jgi:hypothetical protein
MRQADGSPEAAVDLEVLRTATGGDRDLMQELAELYLGNTELMLRGLGDALENKEVDRLRRIGRDLRDASEGVGAGPSYRIFARLEKAAAAGDFDDIRALMLEGRREFDRVQKALGDLR